MGSQYENDLAKELWENTDQEKVMIHTCGYSGNNAFPQPDIEFIHDLTVYNIELKESKKEDKAYIGKSDNIDQLLECSREETEFDTEEYICVKFIGGTWKCAEPIIIQIKGEDEIVAPDEVNVYTTEKNIVVERPDRKEDEWDYTREGREDWEVFADYFDLPKDE